VKLRSYSLTYIASRALGGIGFPKTGIWPQPLFCRDRMPIPLALKRRALSEGKERHKEKIERRCNALHTRFTGQRLSVIH